MVDSINVNLTFLSRSPISAERALESIVRERLEEGGDFKVGMSVNPTRRIIGVGGQPEQFFVKPRQFGVMNRDYRWGVATIYFLYQTDDHGDCQDAERRLIGRLHELAGPQCLNAVGGGGGPRTMTGARYVYLAHSAG